MDPWRQKNAKEYKRIKEIFKEYPVRISLAFLFLLVFMGFNFWESYAPLSIRGWDRKEISRIKVHDPANFGFALFGDNKGNDSVFEPLLRDIDRRREMAFAVGVGDLVKKGKRGPYRRFLKQVREYIAIPLIAAIGNHDLSNGSGNFREIFGPTHYSFQVGEGYFIVLDSTTEAGFDKTGRK